MSEKDIRKLLERACEELDRYARKVVLPGAMGAGLAIRVRLGGAVALADGLGVTQGEARYYVAFGRAF